jgi:regulation of enolase protein 1 (concanavalin A-like superfamily)
MNIVDELNNEFSKQKSLYKVGQQPVAELEKYKQIAMGYAEMENAVSVLSDMHTNVSYVWIKAVRRLDAVEIFYSFNDKEYVMMRNAWLQDNTPVHVGLMAASPDGNGFNATFEHFKVKHLPDLRRQEWLKKNAE